MNDEVAMRLMIGVICVHNSNRIPSDEADNGPYQHRDAICFCIAYQEFSSQCACNGMNRCRNAVDRHPAIVIDLIH